MSSKQKIRTAITDLFGVKHPVMLAGMGVAAGPKLAAAVTNAGGIGVIGGHGYNPEGLRQQIQELKSYLIDKDAPFGVDLLIPQVGGNARKTNYDYSKGKLMELIDVIVEMKTRVFVSAIGIPPKAAVDRLHANGILYMNMIGHPKHVQKCIDNDVDIVCAQGGEAGGHTGDVPFSILIPAVAKLARGQKSKFTGLDVQVVAAGGVSGGESLAAALMLGAAAVWVGTRFIVAEEAGASKAHQDAVIGASMDDTIRTIIFSGRPLRVRKTPYILNWEEKRQDEIKDLTGRGILPVVHDAEAHEDDEEIMDNMHPYLMGVVAGLVNKRSTAREIVDEIVDGAAERLRAGSISLVELFKNDDVVVMNVISRKKHVDFPTLANELPVAYIVRQSSHDQLTEQKIKEYVKGKVAKHKRLEGGVFFMDSIPKSPTEKILKGLPREKAREDVKARRAHL